MSRARIFLAAAGIFWALSGFRAWAQEAETAPAQKAETAPAQEAETAPAQKSEPAPAQEAEPAPAQEAETTPAQEAEPAPAQKSEPAPAQKSEPAPAQRYPLREIDRPLILPDHLSELRTGLSYFDARQYYDPDGGLIGLKGNQEWRLLTAQLDAGYGLLDWMEAGAGIPYYSGKILRSEGNNLGDLYGYARFKILENQAKTGELAFQLKASFPTGDADLDLRLEKKHYFQENLRTGDPSMDFFGAVLGRWSFKKFALRGGFEYGYRLEGEIKSGMTALENVVKFDPGESSAFNLDFLYQVRDWLGAGAGLDYYRQAENKLDGQGLDDEILLIQFRPEAEWQINPDNDLLVQLGVPMEGKDQPQAYPIILVWKSRFK